MADMMVNTTNRGTIFIVNSNTNLNLQTVVDAFLKENNVEKMGELNFKQACDLNTKIKNFVAASKTVLEWDPNKNNLTVEEMQNTGKLD
jgi:hypothetical protein